MKAVTVKPTWTWYDYCDLAECSPDAPLKYVLARLSKNYTNWDPEDVRKAWAEDDPR